MSLRLARLIAVILVVFGGLRPAVAAEGPRQLPESREQVRLSFAPVVEQAAPAVVNIFTAKVVRRRAPTLFDDPFFRRFFGRDFGPGPDFGGGQRQKVQNALGSGVIVRGDGIIVTNNHVIDGADEIKVVLHDRREFEAKILGTDERTDLAVLKIELPKDASLPFLELADSDSLKVGDLVLAIGNPFGVGQTVTSGIVSALARTQLGNSDLSFYIQTDAAINPGNSGGALVGLDGRLVGINSAIFSKSGGSLGIGFAIPSNMVRAVINGVVKGGHLVRPWIGARGRDVNADIAASLGLDRPGGVIVEDVYPGSAAEKSGLKRGDVVLAVNGREVRDTHALRFRIATLPIGETAPLRIWRHGELMALKLEVEAPPETPARDQTELGGRNPLSGSVVVNMSPALGDELGLDAFAKGVLVFQVRDGSPAEQAGLQPGDYVRKVNDKAIGSVKDLVGVLGDRSKTWDITIERRGRQLSERFQG